MMQDRDRFFKDVVKRVTEFLLEYVDENGELGDEFVVAKNIFSQRNIAKLTSTSRQTVNNAL